jgi:UrcA family protein
MNTITTTHFVRRLMVTVLVGAIFSSFAALLAAADGLDPLRVTVKFGDLDVSRPQGAAVLYDRIREAAEKVCPPFEVDSRKARIRRDQCINKAISEAVTKVGQPELSAVYSAKQRKSPATRLASQ